MSFQLISERLKILQESNAQLKELIVRLATINFQPGSVPLASDEESGVLQELAAEIHQTIRDQDEDFEVLKEEVEELDEGKKGSDAEDQKRQLQGAVMRGRRELKTYQSAFRKAQVSAKRKLEAAQRSERDLLLQSYLEPRSSTSSPIPGQQRRRQEHTELTKDEKTVNASSDVTIALRRTHDTMAQELSRSQFAHETLKESTAALAGLSETYSSLDTLLANSKNLLGTLLRSQKSDTWYLETAFYILAITIAWLVWRRLLYGPMWWLLWFPIKIFFKSWMGLFATMGMLGGDPEKVQSMSMSVSTGLGSVLSQSTVVHSSGTRGSKPTGGPPRGHNIQVGGGGRGAPMRPGGAPPGIVPENIKGSISDHIGRIIDESQEIRDLGETGAEPEGEGTEGEEANAEPRNPKKRMWDEDVEAAKHAEEEARKSHDEL